jgi:hypothetical protein
VTPQAAGSRNKRRLFPVLSLLGCALLALFVLPMVWSFLSAVASFVYPATVVSALSSLVSLRAPALSSFPGYAQLGAALSFASRRHGGEGLASTNEGRRTPQHVAWSASFAVDSPSADGQVR